MQVSTSNKQHNLSILLLKDRFRSHDQVIKADSRTKKFEIRDGTQHIGALYIRPTIPNPPGWTTFFGDTIDVSDIGVNKTVAGVLITEASGKLFAVTFGHGRHLLQPDSWVERFGLKVALNSIGQEKIRTIDKRTFDAISRQTKEQASKATEAKNFGLDVEQDLLRGVTGVPKSASMGSRMYGMDSLAVSTNLKIEDIETFLSRIHDKYLDNSYKRDFPWVDHINEVKGKSSAAELDTNLVSQVASGNLDRIWMAVPELIQWEQVGGFCFKMGSREPEFQDIHLPDFLNSLSDSDRQNLSRETFTKKHVHCIHVEGFLMETWQAYKCLYCELTKGGKTYLLSGGKWYAVAGSFVKSVNQSFANIPNFKTTLPEYNDDSEGEYNARVAKKMNGYLALMDKKNISHGGAHSRIEFCDLFSVDRDIVHVKRYGSSSVLSHLFAQGRISGELFQMERTFRGKVNEILPKSFKINDPQQGPETDDYQIVYAIISDIPGELDIPFFSKLNLKNSARNLRGLGYRVAKLKIEVDEKQAKLKKFRKRQKRR
jgi:uncharacterized protein (TIGR04141 family)